MLVEKMKEVLEKNKDKETSLEDGRLVIVTERGFKAHSISDTNVKVYNNKRVSYGQIKHYF